MTAPNRPDFSHLYQATHVTCAFLERHQLDYAVAGGLAVSVWGEPRATFDVDVFVAAETGRADHLRAAIRQEPAFLLDPETLTLPPYTVIVRAHLPDRPSAEPGLILVDFILLDSALARSLLSRRVSFDLGGQPIWICSAEDLILLKLLAGRFKDLQDARGVLALRQTQLDFAYLQDWGQRLNCQQNWAQVCSAPGPSD
jgi:hypothetical protein